MVRDENSKNVRNGENYVCLMVERTGEWVNEWMDEMVNKWMNEWVNVWII